MDEGELEKQLALAEGLRRRPSFSVEPRASGSENFASYGLGARSDIPLGKNSTLSLFGGADAGRGFGRYKDARMPTQTSHGMEFKYRW